MNNRGLIKCIVIITLILAVVFLSQIPYFKRAGQNLLAKTPIIKKENNPLSKSADWLKSNVFDRIGEGAGGEVAKRKDMLEEGISTQKEDLEKKSVDTIKKFIAEKFLGALGVDAEDLLSNQKIQEFTSQLECPDNPQ